MKVLGAVLRVGCVLGEAEDQRHEASQTTRSRALLFSFSRSLLSLRSELLAAALCISHGHRTASCRALCIINGARMKQLRGVFLVTRKR